MSSFRSRHDADQPVATAARRVFRANIALGLLGLASMAGVVAPMFESWRVTAQRTPHRIVVLGQKLSYPTANIGALAVLVLASVGLVVFGAALRALVREWIAQRRFTREVATRCPQSLHGALIIPDQRPQAFCAGLLRPRIYCSSATLELLDQPALMAVLAHERHHARRRDPLRLAAGRVLVRAFFFVPSMRCLAERQQALAEIGADEAAVIEMGGDRAALANAMLGFSEASSPAAGGVDPDRVDHLLGKPLPLRFPVVTCASVTAVFVAMTAAAAVVAHVASGWATLAPPFLSSEPCIVVLALLAALGGAGALRMARSRAQPLTVRFR